MEAINIAAASLQPGSVDDLASTDLQRRADLFSMALEQSQAVSTDDLGAQMVDALRSMQNEYQSVLESVSETGVLDFNGAEVEASPFADFQGAQLSVGQGDSTGFDRSHVDSGVGAANHDGDPLAEGYASMNDVMRETMQTQVRVAQMTVTEDLFSATMGKLQKTNDMLLRGQ